MTRRNRPHMLTRLLFFYAGLAIANLASAWLSGDVADAAGPCFWQGIGFGAYAVVEALRPQAGETE